MSDAKTLDVQAVIDEAAALADELRGRLADLAAGVWDGPPDERGVLEQALAAAERIRAVVPALAGVRHWSDTEAQDLTARVDRRALAAVRGLAVLVRRAEELPVAVSRR